LEEAFKAAETAGAFLLSWRAHGLCYGVPVAYGDALAAGQSVIANVSRGVINEARARLQPVRVLSITASAQALRTCLESRGRETAAEIEDRIARAQVYAVEGGDVLVIRNDGDVARGVALFLEALQQVRLA
jgi:phosphonate metabolism protein PhnN/1,5-bisphosphokinase (PRPP-forming)